MHPFLHKIETFIAQRQLLSASEHYLVALSGGADSVCLLRTMLAIGYNVEAIHCNFHLRGDEAMRDEAFCQQLCAQHGVALHIASFDTRAYAAEKKISLEMAAREQRYAQFDTLLRTRHLAATLVAHHKNDAIETFFLNLTRGTGMEGLKGIAASNGTIRRPLLAVTRDEIIDYLADIQQDYVFDSTNATLDAQRNVVRLQLMPLLRTLNPAAEDNILRTIHYVGSSLTLLRSALAAAVARVTTATPHGISIALPRLRREQEAESILWEVLKDKGFTPQQVEQIYQHREGQTGKQWRSPTHTLTINREELLVEPTEDDADTTLTIPTTGTYTYAHAAYTFARHAIDSAFTPLRDAHRVSIDAAHAAFPLTLRRWQQGDTFVPYGMRGTRLLSDFLTDAKLSRADKRRQVVLTDANGQILWVVGQRTDNRCAITSNTTQALIITRTIE